MCTVSRDAHRGMCFIHAAEGSHRGPSAVLRSAESHTRRSNRGYVWSKVAGEPQVDREHFEGVEEAARGCAPGPSWQSQTVPQLLVRCTHGVCV